MKYPLYVTGPRQGGTNNHNNQNQRSEYNAGAPVVRRFPPVVQYLSRSEQYIEDQLQAIALRTFKDGRSIDEICSAMYQAALSMGYVITIGVQEVYTGNMPSFPRETVMSCLVMIDFTPVNTARA